MELNLKLFFCTFALGDIHHHNHNPLQLALVVELSSTAPLHPNGRSVRVNLIKYLPPASLCRHRGNVEERLTCRGLRFFGAGALGG